MCVEWFCRKKKPHREKKKTEESETTKEEKSTAKEEEIKPADGIPPAVEYLRQWHSDPSNWKFKKNRQTWLLKHVFDPKVLGKDDFKLFLAYVNGMQGRSREDLLERAKKMDTEIVVTDKKDEKSTIERIQKNRAHTIIERYSLSVC